jgi:hypothetical protein
LRTISSEALPDRPPKPDELCDKTSRFTAPFPLPEISSSFILISWQTLETSFSKEQSAGMKWIVASGLLDRASDMISSATGRFHPIRYARGKFVCLMKAWAMRNQQLLDTNSSRNTGTLFLEKSL